MDLKARIAAFESGTPLPAPSSPPPSAVSPSSPAGVGLDELTRSSLEAARRRARVGSSASNASSTGSLSVPSGLGLGQLGGRPGFRRVGSGGSSVGGKAAGVPPQVTLNGGLEGEIPQMRTSPKVPNSSIISLYPTPPSPSRSASSSSVIDAPSLRPLEPTRSPSPSPSVSSIQSTNNGPRGSQSPSGSSSIGIDEFATLVRPSALRANPSSSSLPPVIPRKPAPPPPATAFNLGIPQPKAPPPPMPTTPKPHRSSSASARGPTLSLQTATPEGSPDLGSDMIRFSPVGGRPPTSADRFGASSLRRATSAASTTSSDGSGAPPPLPSRPKPPSASSSSLNPTASISSPSKHKPTLSTSSFQSVELSASDTEADQAATPIATSPARPPPLPQRKPTLPLAAESDSTPISYAPRVRRVPPPVPVPTPPTLSPRPSFQSSANSTPMRSSYRPAPPPPKPSQASEAARARYGASFVKLVALRRVARMKRVMSGGGAGGAGWKRASVVEGGEERLDGLVVRKVWERSKLDGAFLKGVWARADPGGVGSLDREGFVRGMGEIDAELGRRRRSGR